MPKTTLNPFPAVARRRWLLGEGLPGVPLDVRFIGTDGIALRAGATVLGAVHETADRYVVQLNLVVDPNAGFGAQPSLNLCNPNQAPSR